MDSLSHTQRNWLPAYTITLCTAASILLWIRLLSRCQRTSGQFGIDDLFIAIAWVLSMAWGALIVISALKYGLNRHIWDVPPNLWGAGAKISFQIEVLFFFATCFAKMSVLLFYRRLVAGTYSRTYKWVLWCSIGFVVLYTIVFFALICATCFPMEAQWRQYDPTYTTKWHCASVPIQYKIALLTGVLSVVSDLYSVLLPTLLLLSLSITTRQKVGLILIFGTGFLVVSAGIVRTYYLVRVESGDIDKTWNGFNVFVAGIAELNLGIMCACAPSIQHFFKGFLRSLSKISSISGTSSSHSGAQNPGRPGLTDLETSRVEGDSEVKRWVEKESGSADPRKYRTTPIHTNFETPVFSPAPSRFARRGQNPADDSDTYNDDDRAEDWTNSSKFVV